MLKDYIKNRLGYKRGPNKLKPDKNGFIKNNLRGKTDVMSTSFIEKNKSWGIDTNYRLHSCYKDTSDKNTLEFWVIHYDKSEPEPEV